MSTLHRDFLLNLTAAAVMTTLHEVNPLRVRGQRATSTDKTSPLFCATTCYWMLFDDFMRCTRSELLGRNRPTSICVEESEDLVRF